MILVMLFWCGNAYSLTLYCDSDEWNNYLTLDVNYELKIVQHNDFKEGLPFKADISEKTIFFIADGEHWTIDRINGKFIRKNFEVDINQTGKCSTNKPKFKQKF